MPVGIHVPGGYYDRKRAAWVPSDDGRVIKVLSSAGGVAAIDADGDDAADSDIALAALGVTADELQQIAALYQPGQTLWRVPVPHFTSWDFNYAFGCEADSDGEACAPPTGDDPLIATGPQPDPCITSGSIIECENQGLGEDVEVTGTPFRLSYRSMRQLGRKAERTVTIHPPTKVSSNALGFAIEVTVAGQRFRQQLPVTERKSITFLWDGRDAYGRPYQGSAPVVVRTGFLYRPVYAATAVASGGRSFANGQHGSALGVLARYCSGTCPDDSEVFFGGLLVAWKTWTGTLNSWTALPQGLGGWSLSIHHAYDVVGRRLLLGDGSQHSDKGALASVITTAVGTGAAGYGGDGGPAATATLNRPVEVAVGADGALFIADTSNNRIRRVGPDGIITTVAGTGVSGYSGDGGPATAAKLWAHGVAVGADGALILNDPHNNRIRRVAPDGIITTVAGTGAYGYSGDGGPATAAALNMPNGVAVGADGALFIADTSNNRIRRVGPDGIITTVAGTGAYGYSGDGGPATAATLASPTKVAVGPDGALSIADRMNNRIRRVGPDGIITTVAGTGAYGYSGDGGPATAATIGFTQIAVGAVGALFISDSSNNRIRVVRPGLPGWTVGDFLVTSEDGSKVFRFSSSGRHLRTLDSRTKAVVYSFAYDSNGRLASITDRDGQVTTIERSGDAPTAIVAPYGQRTALSTDGTGYLSAITNPAGEPRSYSYNADTPHADVYRSAWQCPHVPLRRPRQAHSRREPGGWFEAAFADGPRRRVLGLGDDRARPDYPARHETPRHRRPGADAHGTRRDCDNPHRVH
jgi:YD repeat-containing protein